MQITCIESWLRWWRGPLGEPDFVGVSALVAKQAEQLGQFEAWAREGRYGEFSVQHYDWWMFPIDRTSVGQGGKYTVCREQVEELKGREEFMRNYRRGVELLMQSWEVGKFDGPLVRLGKVLQSLELFGETGLFERVQRFARREVDAGQLEGRMSYLRAWI